MVLSDDQWRKRLLSYLDRFGPWDFLDDDVTQFIESIRGEKLVQLSQRKKAFRQFLAELLYLHHDTNAVDEIQQIMGLRGMFWLSAVEFTNASQTRLEIKAMEKKRTKNSTKKNHRG